ncbi:985_t:CDS:1, partial [Acaulospora colombiana]
IPMELADRVKVYGHGGNAPKDLGTLGPRLVSALQTEIRDQYFTEEFRNAIFTLCAIDHKNKK